MIIPSSRLVIPALAGCIFVFSAFGADMETAEEQYQKRDFAAAETTLREILAEEADHGDANLLLGRVLISREKFKEAEPVLEKALVTKPEARVVLGESYMMQDRLGDAIKAFDAAATTQDKNSELHLRYGMTLLKQKKYPDAAKKFQRSLELNPKEAYAHYYMGITQNSLGRADLMLENFRKFLELQPDAPEAARVRSLLRTR